MAFGRSNSLSINTGATNSLFPEVDLETIRRKKMRRKKANSAVLTPDTPATYAPIPPEITSAIHLCLSTTKDPSVAMSKQGPNLLQIMLNAQRERAAAEETVAEEEEVKELTREEIAAEWAAARAELAGLTDGSAQQQSSTQPAALSLFGTNATNPTTTSTTTSLFGTAGSNNNPTQQNQNTGTSSLFGGATNNAQSSQPTLGGSLFGGGNNTTSHHSATGGSLFGGGNTAQPTAGGSLFGGNKTTTQAGSLFGNQNQTQTTASTSLFGQPATAQSAQTGTGSLFNTNPNAGSNLFGNSTTQNAPSLLGATQATQQPSSFGRLSMGQGAAAAGGQAASQVTQDNLRPTTRFEDCADQVRQELEQMDKMIQQQETFCKQIEAIMPKHEEDVNTLLPDINFVKDKADDVEQSLASDAQGVDARRKHAEKDRKDLERLSRIVTNLGLPQPYQYPNLSISGLGGMYNSQQRPQQQQAPPDGEDPANYDTDLIGNYFLPLTAELQQTMNSYASNLAEIEQHMRVVESSTVAQAQQLAQRRSDVNGGSQPSSDETVRELASTLRGFEESILGVAGIVGECREGVNELVLGRLGTHLGASAY